MLDYGCRLRKRSGKLTRRKTWKVSIWATLYKDRDVEAGATMCLHPRRSDGASTHAGEALPAMAVRPLKEAILREAKAVAVTATKNLSFDFSC